MTISLTIVLGRSTQVESDEMPTNVLDEIFAPRVDVGTTLFGDASSR
jgi:hypothetical protein